MNRVKLEVNGVKREFYALGGGFIHESVANGSCPFIGMWVGGSLASAVRKSLVKPCCSSCRRSEIKVEADGYFIGKYETEYGKTAPFRGWLCNDHAEIMLNDGAKLTQIK